MGFWDFLTGTPAKVENVSTLRPEQEALYQQLINAGKSRGAGGSFGQSADYYRDLLGNDSTDYDAFAAPALRQYREDIIPGLSEQFAGMGAGGLSSSAFRNAQNQGAIDLAERLGALRANLRQYGAQGLGNIGAQGLQSFSQNMVTQPGTEGFLSTALPAALSAVGSAAGGPALGALGNFAGNAASNWFSGKGNKVGANTSGYASAGTGIKASPNIGMGMGTQLPAFLQGNRGY